MLYPNGCHEAKDNSISIFLTLPNSSVPDRTTKLLVKYTLRFKDQMDGGHVEFESETKNSYCTTSSIRVHDNIVLPKCLKNYETT